MKPINTIMKIDGIEIVIPDDCPDRDIFKKVVLAAKRERFDGTHTVEQCRDQWRATQVVPEPFASNRHAANHYKCALLALSPEARAWVSFEEEVNRQFADYEDDGERKDPAIPGWTPDWVVLGG